MSPSELIRGSPEGLLRGSRMPDDPKLMKRCPDCYENNSTYSNRL